MSLSRASGAAGPRHQTRAGPVDGSRQLRCSRPRPGGVCTAWSRPIPAPPGKADPTAAELGSFKRLYPIDHRPAQITHTPFPQETAPPRNPLSSSPGLRSPTCADPLPLPGAAAPPGTGHRGAQRKATRLLSPRVDTARSEALKSD